MKKNIIIKITKSTSISESFFFFFHLEEEADHSSSLRESDHGGLPNSHYLSLSAS